MKKMVAGNEVERKRRASEANREEEEERKRRAAVGSPYEAGGFFREGRPQNSKPYTRMLLPSNGGASSRPTSVSAKAIPVICPTTSKFRSRK